MAEMPTIEATLRTGTGKGAAREARRNGLVPGVVYGGGEDPVTINVPFNDLFKKVKAGRFLSTLFNLKLEGHEDVRVICRNVQRDVVKDLPTHLDLMRLRRTSRVNLFVPVNFVGEEDAPGVRNGGVLTAIRTEIELKVTAGNIPEQIDVDVSGLNIGDNVSISDVTLPEGTRPMILDRDFLIANVSPPSGLASQKDDEEGEEAAGEDDAT
ncbi:MAG: 50S ribosomal protein L25/general stress protein Ctc [Pseudomonadota bacterium]